MCLPSDDNEERELFSCSQADKSHVCISSSASRACFLKCALLFSLGVAKCEIAFAKTESDAPCFREFICAEKRWLAC
jgi:hypothetical protein